MKIKKITAFTVALIITFSAYCQSVFAEDDTVTTEITTVSEEESEGTVTFDKETGTLTLRGHIDNSSVRQ